MDAIAACFVEDTDDPDDLDDPDPELGNKTSAEPLDEQSEEAPAVGEDSVLVTGEAPLEKS